jgi:hypothetical protein
MRNANNLQFNCNTTPEETTAGFVLTNLEMHANKIIVCLLDAGMPETEVWQAFRTAVSTLNRAADEIDHEEFFTRRTDIDRNS